MSYMNQQRKEAEKSIKIYKTWKNTKNPLGLIDTDNTLSINSRIYFIFKFMLNAQKYIPYTDPQSKSQ